VGTRTVTQVRTHGQKYFLKFAKQQQPADGAAAQGSGRESWTASDEEAFAAA
jgi:hypothetical protein